MRANHQKKENKSLLRRTVAAMALLAMLFSCASSQALAVSIETDAADLVMEDARMPDPDTTEDIVEIPIEDTAEDIVEIPIEDTVEDVVETPAEDTTEDIVETPAEDTAEDIVEIPIEDTFWDIMETPIEDSPDADDWQDDSFGYEDVLDDWMLDDALFSVDLYAGGESPAVDEDSMLEGNFYYYGKDDNGVKCFYAQEDDGKKTVVSYGRMENFLKRLTIPNTIIEFCVLDVPRAIENDYEINNGAEEEWSPYVPVTLQIKNSNNNRAIVVKDGSLTLSGNLTLRGIGDSPSETTPIRIGPGGTLNIWDGVTVTGMRTTAAAGALYINGGTFNLYGGVLKDNTAKGNGGCVLLRKDGGDGGVGATFNMYGGTISDNTAGANGGGVMIEKGCTFNLYGGTISGNIADTNGGGVKVVSGGTFQMSGGTISGNTASGNGGGVEVGSGGTFNLYGGTIAGNTSTADGGNSAGLSINGTTTIIGGTVDKTEGTPLTDGEWYTVETGLTEGFWVQRSDLTITLGDAPYEGDYSFYDTYTDAEGKIYLWLPTGCTVSYKHTGEYESYNYKALIEQRETKDDPHFKKVPFDTSNVRSVRVGTILRAVLITDVSPGATESYSLYSFEPMLLAEEAKTTPSKVQIISYEWESVYTGNKDSQPNETTEWVSRSGPSVDETYTPAYDDMGCWVRAVITTDRKTKDGSDTQYVSEPVWVEAPQISVKVPLRLVIEVDPTGTCTLQSSEETTITDVSNYLPDELSGETALSVYDVSGAAASSVTRIQNNSNVPIYLTGVTFTWADGTASDSPAPSEVFTNWYTDRPKLSLSMNGSPLEGEESADGNNTVTWDTSDVSNEMPANGWLELSWAFALNTNAIRQELDADKQAKLGTITYLVSYHAP